MKPKIRRIGFAVLGSALLVAGLLFVYLEFLRPTPWPEDAIRIPEDARTMGEALARVKPGGTIVLSDEPFTLSDPVRIEVSGITIAGRGSGARLMAEGAVPALSILADGVSVRDLEIASESVGILVEASGCRLERITVQGASIGIQLFGARDNRLEELAIHDGQTGLELVTSDRNRLEDLTISAMQVAGIRVLGSWENRIERVQVSGAPVGAILDQGSAENALFEIDVHGAEDVAILVSASNDNTVQQSTIRASASGIAVERSTGTVIQQCQIEAVQTTGISLLQALQNRIERNAITGFGETGIHLTQSGENAILSNRISDAAGTGILLEQSNKNLLHGNDVRQVPVGLWLDETMATRLLRNTVAECSEACIVLLDGENNRLLDNVLLQGGLGLLVAGGAENTVLRNRMEEHSDAAVLVGSSASQTRILSNEFRTSAFGLLISGSGKAEILGNSFIENPVGLQLISPASGLRIEANVFEANGIGLDLAGEPAELSSAVEDQWGIRTWHENASYASPVLTNNSFVDNTTLDIRATETLPLYAAGNWWGTEADRDAESAKVSGSVDLRESAWVGTLALGTESETAQILLGRILQLVLEDAGYRVIDLIGMGNGLRMQHALRTGDVDLVWWTGAEEEPATWVIEPIPATEGWIPVVSEALSAELPDASMASLAAQSAATGERLVVAVPIAFGEDALTDFLSAYGLDEVIEAVSWTQTLEEAETLLKFGVADLAVVGSLDETVTRSGFVRLADSLHALEFGEIAAVLSTRVAGEFPELQEIIRELGSRLTANVLHDLMGRVRLMHRTPIAVATEFLQREGLLAE